MSLELPYGSAPRECPLFGLSRSLLKTNYSQGLFITFFNHIIYVAKSSEGIISGSMKVLKTQDFSILMSE